MAGKFVSRFTEKANKNAAMRKTGVGIQIEAKIHKIKFPLAVERAGEVEIRAIIISPDLRLIYNSLNQSLSLQFLSRETSSQFNLGSAESTFSASAPSATNSDLSLFGARVNHW